MSNWRQGGRQYGTHEFTRGPQILVDKDDQIVARASTLPAARKIRTQYPGTRIVCARFWGTGI